MSDKRIIAHIDLNAIDHNIDQLYKIMPNPKPIMAVIKADGYGHGAVEIAKHINNNDKIYGFATATVEEALLLRNNNISKPILILGYVFEEDYKQIIDNNISVTIFDYKSASRLNEISIAGNKKASVHIKVDTGMSRIGIKPDAEGIDFVRKISKFDGLIIDGIFTHFAKADEVICDDALMQFKRFNDFISQIDFINNNYIVHCANSASILQLPQTHLSIVRAGIVLYGLWPSDEMKYVDIDLKPVMTVKSHIIFIKNIPANTAISYGGTYVSDRDSVIATIPVGYADGYPRSLSNKGYVIINNTKLPIVGRICMDQMMVDITDCKAEVGDEVILIGKSENESITAEELGDLSGRFNYELVCDISPRVPRQYN